MTFDYESDQDTYDQTFEPFYELIPGAYEQIAEYLLRECDNAVPRKRSRKRVDQDQFKKILVLITANALRASTHPTSKKVHYSRKAESFSGSSILYPDWLRHTNLIKGVDSMGKAGFLDLTMGKQRNHAFAKMPQSTFQITDNLISHLAALGVTASDVIKSDDAPVVILKDAEKKPIEYLPDKEPAKGLIERVRAYNDYIKEFDIRLKLSNWEMTELHATREKDGRPRPPTNFNDISLRRVFNNGSFGDGGRWFGGWWITIPSKYRSAILINQKRTVELDFSGFLTRAIYHYCDIDYLDDPYEIEEIHQAADAQGLDWEKVRDSIKKLLNVLINAGESDKVGKISGLMLPKGYGLPNRVYPLIEKKHEPIKDWFRSGAGVAVMRMESDICEGILLEGKRKGILVLPVHDSFVVQEEHEDWLRKAMFSHYRYQFRFDPKIKEKDGIKDSNQLSASNEEAPSSSSLKGSLKDPSIVENVTAEAEDENIESALENGSFNDWSDYQLAKPAPDVRPTNSGSLRYPNHLFNIVSKMPTREDA